MYANKNYNKFKIPAVLLGIETLENHYIMRLLSKPAPGWDLIRFFKLEGIEQSSSDAEKFGKYYYGLYEFICP